MPGFRVGGCGAEFFVCEGVVVGCGVVDGVGGAGPDCSDHGWIEVGSEEVDAMEIVWMWWMKWTVQGRLGELMVF